eukprot:7344319-Pyramimonas_sp.AAC.1
MIDDIFRRFRVAVKNSKSCKILVGILVDLEKAFDLLPRDAIWSEVHRLVENAGFTLMCAELHNGTCYLFKDPKSGKVVAKLAVQLGVRQGSVEGPLLFIIAYNVVLLALKAAKQANLVAPITAKLDLQE